MNGYYSPRQNRIGKFNIFWALSCLCQKKFALPSRTRSKMGFTYRGLVKDCNQIIWEKNIFSFALPLCWRCGGLMVSAHVPGASGPGSSPDRGHCVGVLGKTYNSHTQWAPENFKKSNKSRGSDLRWTSIPSRGSRNTPSSCLYTETGINSGSYEAVGSKASLHFDCSFCFIFSYFRA